MQERIRRSYNRVTQKMKDQLVHLVLKESLKIKEAAKQLGLKYAAAKSIMVMYKKKQRSQISHISDGKRCGIKKIQKQANSYELVCCIFGEIVSKKIYR